MTRSDEIAAIELTPEEIQEAIRNAKIAKWNKQRNAPYWEAAERVKPKDYVKENRNHRKTGGAIQSNADSAKPNKAVSIAGSVAPKL